MEEIKDIIELADGTKYVIVDTVKIDDINYAYLVNEDDKNDSLFQRISYENQKPVFSFIKSDEEFNTVLKQFGEKYKELLEN